LRTKRFAFSRQPSAPKSGSLTFREFVGIVRPGYRWYRHCEVLADVLQRVADGDLQRVAIFEPPRHGKSEEVSRLFTAYYLHRHPGRWVGINSYAAELAYTLSRAARDNYLQAGGEIRRDAAAVRHWQTPAGGGMWAAGVGGPITGKGFHLGIIDDPVKNAEDAASEAIREKQKEWYRSTFSTREEPGGAVILIQTRWHEDDLAGFVLAQEADEEPERWHIVCLPAIAEEETPQFPESCSVEPDWRQPGEPLCPERYPIERLQKLSRRLGSYFWTALFQQRPSLQEGNLFKAAWFAGRYRSLTDVVEVWVTWDTALKEAESNDQSAYVAWAQKASGEVCILDARRGHWSTPDLEQFLCQQADWLIKVYGRAFRGVYIEDKVSGTTLIRYIRRNRPDLAVIPVPAEADKVARAQGVTPICEAGRILLPDATIYPETRGWVEDLLYVLAVFPKGRWKDLVDAFVYGCMRVMGTIGGRKSRRGKRGGYA